MTIMHQIKASVIAIFLFACNISFAQNFVSSQPVQPPSRNIDAPGIAWRKQVARLIDMREKEDTASHHLRDMSSDTSLFEMIINAIDDGRLIAYSPMDTRFSVKLSKEVVNEMVSSRVDTIMLQDPLTAEWSKKLVNNDFNYNAIHKYRILEDWTFNVASGKTKIQVVGIAPTQDVYGEDGNFRGTSNMFWLQYADARPILDIYEQYHPGNTVAGHIWDDYFKNDGKLGVQR
jgi:hypothetical protein